ncbi:Uncharacterised protein [Phocoenobacter uteri]|uniref:Phage lysis regulatory protein, LysB family n=1 Tax=Phocoenobacter uteri TaxID=146806 RepID=A0A379CAB0_9PAST|nr:hypothetical protein [Phocoenobacter uteri]MDG6881049.1 hypothetical protein [Phocoenobacter uteri]SUB59068.1 Uncharacterised protein [Phocoenobacter uteri]
MGLRHIATLLKIGVFVILIAQMVYIKTLKVSVKRHQAETAVAQQKADYFASANQNLKQLNAENIKQIERYQELNRDLSKKILKRLNQQEKQNKKLLGALNEKANQNWSNGVIPNNVGRLLNTKNNDYRDQPSPTNADTLPNHASVSDAATFISDK